MAWQPIRYLSRNAYRIFFTSRWTFFLTHVARVLPSHHFTGAWPRCSKDAPCSSRSTRQHSHLRIYVSFCYMSCVLSRWMSTAIVKQVADVGSARCRHFSFTSTLKRCAHKQVITLVCMCVYEHSLGFSCAHTLMQRGDRCRVSIVIYFFIRPTFIFLSGLFFGQTAQYTIAYHHDSMRRMW